jgi:N-acetyl sugar amidotransferase
MIIYSKREQLVSQVDYLTRYEIDPERCEVLYGLPRHPKFCDRCVISNQRPNSTVEFQHSVESEKTTISLDENNVCDACRLAENKDQRIDWVDRESQLVELCDKYRKNGSGYDCLIPGSGGKDSFFAAHILKYKYNMNPLTTTWAPHLYTEWGWKNFQAWLKAGFDNYLVTPNPRMHRLITRLAVENLFHPFQPFILGQKGLAPRMAALFDIPLVFYGENEAEYGNPIKDTTSAKRDWMYFSEEDTSKIFLGGVSIQRLKTDFDVKQVDLEPYLPINPERMRNKNVEVHYLGYYIPWHPQGAYYYAVENGGFEASPERTPGTYSKYNSIDDKIDDFHYYTTFIKFGIGRATYDASQEIRNKEITREEGVALVKKYDGEFPTRFADEIFDYLSIPADEYPVASQAFEQAVMDKQYFDDLSDSFRSPHLWLREAGNWKLRRTVWHS